jgi:hypothetical protein
MDYLEADLINLVKRQFISKYMIFEEVGFLNRCIDMVLIDDSDLITIEFKINDWRKGITQIKEHLVVADYSYLCMPKKTISKELSAELTKIGIGLWQFDYDADELIEAIKPKKSSYQWEFHKCSLIERLSMRDN